MSGGALTRPPGALTRAARAWSRFWFGPADPLPAALFRLSLGVLLAVLFVAESDDWGRFYGRAGILALDDPALARDAFHQLSLFTVAGGIVSPAAVWWIGVAAALMFTVGCWTRTSALVLFLVRSSLLDRDPAVVSGEDYVARLLLFFSCFAGLGAAYSVDAWRRRRRGLPRRRAEAWPVRLIQLHVVLLYAFTQANKLRGDPSWASGDAMYYVMVNATWSRWPWPALFYGRAAAAVATYGSLLVETAFPVLVWFPRTRLVTVLAVAFMHTAIAVVLSGVTFFSLMMLPPLWLFLREGDVRLLLRRPAAAHEPGLTPAASLP